MLFRSISEQKEGTFENICKTFTSTYQIKTWLYSTLKHTEDLDPVDTDSEDWGVAQLREKKFNIFRFIPRKYNVLCTRHISYNH